MNMPTKSHYGVVQIRAISRNKMFYPSPIAEWVDYGDVDTRSTALDVARSMREQGFITRILKKGDRRLKD